MGADFHGFLETRKRYQPRKATEIHINKKGAKVRKGKGLKSMHEHYEKANKWTKEAISAALEVHSAKGPGLLEPIYEKCMMRELEIRNIPSACQLDVPIEYKGYTFEQPLRLDVIIDGCLILELKSVEKVLPVHKAQLLSYMKLLDAPIGLLINFHEPHLRNGINRMLLKGADSN